MDEKLSLGNKEGQVTSFPSSPTIPATPPESKVITRRGLLKGMLLLGVAPAIVRAESLMKIVAAKSPFLTEGMLEEAMIELMNKVDTSGRFLPLFPTRLIVPPKHFLAAQRLLGPKIKEPNNSTNVLKGPILEVVEGGPLIPPNSWYLQGGDVRSENFTTTDWFAEEMRRRSLNREFDALR